MKDKDSEIAIVGIGCNFPGGEGLDNFWKVLFEGKNCTVQIPSERFDQNEWYDQDDNKAGKSRTAKAAFADGFNNFDQKFFGITDAEMEQMDPQHKMLLLCTYRALENAGMPLEKASGSKTGVFLGLMNRDYELTMANVNPVIINHCTGTGIAMSIAANRISYTFNFTGPSLSIDCACSSSLVALHLACQAMRQGDCEMAVFGGVNCIFQPRVFVALSKAKMISPDGTSKPFSNTADGYGRGEGCGVILLKPLKKALHDHDHIWGIVCKTAVNQDGHTVTPITKPSMIQQEQLLNTIYSTETYLSDIQYLEAHGTGTPVGDSVEAESISKVIAKARSSEVGPLLIGSVKSNIGHTESAAGVAGLIKVLLMMKHETIVPSVFYSEESSSIDVKALNVKIPTKAEKWVTSNGSVRIAGINNFGFGGTNAHAVVKQYLQAKKLKEAVKKQHNFFVLSAATEKSLANMIEDTVENINTKNITDLQSLAYTSGCRRSHWKHKYRKAFHILSLADLKEKLVNAQNKKSAPAKQYPRLVFVFCGNGVTYRGMCKQLLKEESIFRDKIREIENLFQRYMKIKLVETLESEFEQEVGFSKPEIVQPLLFAVQVAIANLLMHWGIKPDAVLGHSVGEVAAAHCSGLLSLEDAVKVIYYRSNLQSRVIGGKMLVVSNMPVSNLLKILPSYSGRICLAAQNSPQSCTLSGDKDAIDCLHKSLCDSDDGKNLFLRVLDVPAAYHSHMMDPIVEEVENSIGQLHTQNMETELFSTVTGDKVCKTDFVNGKYWARNIREPVAFEQALKSVKQTKNAIFVEIGPRRALQRNIIETLGSDTVVLSSVQPDKDLETMLTVVSKLFEVGFNIDWDKFYKGCEMEPLPFPRYLFDSVKKDVLTEATLSGDSSTHPAITQLSKNGLDFSCNLSSGALSYLYEHKHQGVAIVPGAFYVELGLAAVMTSVKPKQPLSCLQLSIRFHTPCVLSRNTPDVKVRLDLNESSAGHCFQFKVHSVSVNYASGKVESTQARLPEESYISLNCVFKRCQSVVSSEEFYKNLSLGGFQYGSIFKIKENVYYGEELGETYSVVTVPDEILPQLHDYYIHPVVLDYLMQLVPVTGTYHFLGRPGFPSQIGSLTVFEPLQKKMVVYLKATHIGNEELTICGCFTDKEGRVLVELKNVIITYLGNCSRVVEEYFYHNSYSIVSEHDNLSTPKSLVFADNLGISTGLKPYLDPASKYISLTYNKVLIEQEFEVFLSDLNIRNVSTNFQEVLFMWGVTESSSHKADNVLECMASYCEIFRKIVAGLKSMHFQNSIRVVTFRSSGGSVNHISPGFALSGMTRACAAELSDLSFQLIDIDSTKDIKALAEIIRSYPCSKYPELVIKDCQILKPQITHTPILDSPHHIVHKSQCESFILQTSDPYRVTSLSAVVSDECTEPIQGKNVEVHLCKICMHSSDYFPVSVSDIKFAETLYWSEQTSQNHKLLALDFSGTVTAVGKDVKELKVGDHIVSCYPVTASSKVVIPADACYKTKRFSFLKDIPCVSYCILAWEILHCALPKVRHKKLGIFSTIPDSVLVKILTGMAVKSGWSVTVAKNPNQMSHDFSEMAGIVLLPPNDETVIRTASQITSVKDVIVVADSQPNTFVSQLAFRGHINDVHMKILFTSSLLQKQLITARRPHVLHLLKNMCLDKIFAAIETNTIQNSKRGNIDCLPSESYFRCQTMPVIALSHDTKDEPSDIPLIPKAKKLFQKHAVYIVTGGLSGLGFQTVKFIAHRGGGNIVILSRSGANDEIKQEINNVKNQCQCVITRLQCDVSISEQVHQAVAQIRKLFPFKPIKGVFHSAVILHDGLIENLNKSLYEKVMRPKVNGVINLHYATKHCDLDYFVCYSSISAYLGNASQTNYASANSFMDTFCQYRRNIGLAGQAINWGALNLGLLLNQHHFQKFLESKGMMILEVTEIHDSLEQCLLINKPQQVVCRFHFKNIRYNVLSQNKSLTMRLSALVEEELKKAKMINSKLEQTNTISSPNEYIKSLLSENTHIEQDELSDDIHLSSLGIDSMMAMTLQNIIFQDKGLNVPLVTLLDPEKTVSDLVKTLVEIENGGNQESNNDLHPIMEKTRF
ncbi:phenolphthiocerol/phthiocerol polyketide synthase subunit C [Silurus meridionalis]|uniref:phenolphthiocerol/phthiocerol polyketide synthase subunit C n=1 Tax=Silurus meridionalis TaxID=175797 RepID=UPI001EEA0BAD|nr:phenolphthiocerol/phthiocerol polyketide synthase subunit C [Silurus meridionalis]